jgi:hypothetical protein
MIASVLLAAALAASPPTELRIERAAARVVVVPARGGSLSVSVKPGGQGPAPRVRREGAALVVDGGQASAGHGGIFDVLNLSRCKSDPASLPVVTVRAPPYVRITGSGALFGRVGPADSLMLDTEGCGRWSVGSIAGPVWIRAKGDTRVEVAGHAPKAELYAFGSSDIHHTGEVGTLTAEVHGASKVRVKLVDGQVDSVVDGSGDVLYSRPSTGKYCTLC